MNKLVKNILGRDEESVGLTIVALREFINVFNRRINEKPVWSQKMLKGEIEKIYEKFLKEIEK